MSICDRVCHISLFHFFGLNKRREVSYLLKILKDGERSELIQYFLSLAPGSLVGKPNKGERSELFFIFPLFGKGKVCLRNEPYFFAKQLCYIFPVFGQAAKPKYHQLASPTARKIFQEDV